MRLRILFIAAALAWPLGQARSQQSFRVVTYNVENYILEPIQNRPLKKPFAQAKIVESILAAKPDVIALQEMGKKTALAKLQAALKAKGLDLPYVEHLSAFDPAIHVAYLSRFPFKKNHAARQRKLSAQRPPTACQPRICRGGDRSWRLLVFADHRAPEVEAESIGGGRGGDAVAGGAPAEADH